MPKFTVFYDYVTKGNLNKPPKRGHLEVQAFDKREAELVFYNEKPSIRFLVGNPRILTQYKTQ